MSSNPQKSRKSRFPEEFENDDLYDPSVYEKGILSRGRFDQSSMMDAFDIPFSTKKSKDVKLDNLIPFYDIDF